MRPINLLCKSLPDVGIWANGVDRHWAVHTVGEEVFSSVDQSLAHLAARNRAYPLYAEYCRLYDNHEDEIILDFGCGPGNDILGFAIYSAAREIIGLDISRKALTLARDRLCLHGVLEKRVRLIHAIDSRARIPINNGTVDYINCLGVLHHVSNPAKVLKEFHRVLRSGGEAVIMTYNLDSIYLHLTVPYELQALRGLYPRLDAKEAYARFSDGGAPISRLARFPDMLAMFRDAGFTAKYVGGAFSQTELDSWQRNADQAMADPVLPEKHRRFLLEVTINDNGYPCYQGYTAGLDSVFHLRK